MKKVSSSLKAMFTSWKITLILLVHYVILLAAATFVEKAQGTAMAREIIYNNPLFYLLQFLLILNFCATAWQTRLWMDDMFMITAVQAQAYRVTQDMKYITRAAREMVVYLDSLQLDNGLFYHAPSAPYCWGRANGWMAVGMAELLRILPETNPDYAEIMAAYLKMMKTLKETQNEKGMWRQLVDDPELWEETSGSAMFTYAMIVGVKKGWLDAKEYGEVARKGWIALCSYIDKAGDVKAVCEGTMIKNSREHYINRLALTGDLHGQAPVLWCAYALVTDFKTNK